MSAMCATTIRNFSHNKSRAKDTYSAKEALNKDLRNDPQHQKSR